MSAGAYVNTTETCVPQKYRKLYWFKSKISGQLMESVLDSAATVSCIARRCITSNRVLNKLSLQPCNDVVLGANKKPLVAKHYVRVTIVVGSPSVSVDVDMIVVDNLPYSCLIGTDVLSKFRNWGIDNISSILTLNSSSVQVYDKPQHDVSVNLITSCKTTLFPGETKLIRTRARGPGIVPNRPVTDQLIMCEGIPNRECRSAIRVFPSLNSVGFNNSNDVYIQATNASNQFRTIGKGVKIAQGHDDFVDIEDCDSVNIMNHEDVIDIVFNRKDVPHLSDSEFSRAREVLSEFKDIFSVSNEKIRPSTECSFGI